MDVADIDEVSQTLGRIEEGQKYILQRLDHAETVRREMTTQLGHLPAMQQTMNSMSNRIVALEKKVEKFEWLRQRILGAVVVISAAGALVVHGVSEFLQFLWNGNWPKH